MYKVFIKKHLVIISTKGDFYEHFDRPDLTLENPKRGDIKLLLEKIKFKRKRRLIHLVSNNPEKTFKKLKSLFKIIKAAGGVVKNKKGEILFIFRNNKWDLPKGKLEKGEKIHVCAVREVEEECGISGVKLKDHLITTYHTYKDHHDILKPCYWYNMRYKGNEELVPQLEEGITDVRWIAPKDFDTIYGNTYNSIIDVLEKIED